MSLNTPDGVRYTAMQTGRTAKPFHFRWLLPFLCKNKRSWQIAAWASGFAYLALVGAYTGTWQAPILALSLSGVIGYNLKHPVLVDLPAMALALGSVVALDAGLWYVAIVLVLLAGCTKESSPVFAACWAWSPLLLVGLVPVLVRALIRPGSDPLSHYPEHVEILKHPIRSSWRFHKDEPIWIYVLPWGICVLGIANGSPQLWVTLAFAYAQLLVATDSVRLYQWAAPVAILTAVPMLPAQWLPVLLVLHLINPFRSDGA
jgi:hypothetical protein